MCPYATDLYVKAYRAYNAYTSTLKNCVSRLEDLGDLKKWKIDSEWSDTCLIIPEKNGTLRLTTDFKESNRIIQRNPFPMPNIKDYLDSIVGFQYDTVIGLNIRNKILD